MKEILSRISVANNVNFFVANPATKNYCKICHYKTNRKSNFDEHLMTSKHQKSTFSNLFQPISSKNQQSSNFECQNYKGNNG
jgi:hypothetical protein